MGGLNIAWSAHSRVAHEENRLIAGPAVRDEKTVGTPLRRSPIFAAQPPRPHGRFTLPMDMHDRIHSRDIGTVPRNTLSSVGPRRISSSMTEPRMIMVSKVD
jgi:hypothetical protein